MHSGVYGLLLATLAPRVSKAVTGRISLGLLMKCSDTEVLTSVQKNGRGGRRVEPKGELFCEKSGNWDEQAIGNLIWNIHIFIVRTNLFNMHTYVFGETLLMSVEYSLKSRLFHASGPSLTNWVAVFQVSAYSC